MSTHKTKRDDHDDDDVEGESGGAKKNTKIEIIAKSKFKPTVHNFNIKFGFTKPVLTTLSSLARVLEVAVLKLKKLDNTKESILEIFGLYESTFLVVGNVVVFHEHIGDEMYDHPILFKVSEFLSSFKQIASKGSINMYYDKSTMVPTIQFKCTETYHCYTLSIPTHGNSIGDVNTKVPTNIPADVLYSIALEVTSLRKFIQYLKGSTRVVQFQFRQSKKYIFLNIYGESTDSIGTTSAFQLFGTVPDASSDSTSTSSSSSVSSTTVLASTNTYTLDENKLQRPVCAGNKDQVQEEIEIAMSEIEDDPTVKTSTFRYATQFIDQFLAGLDVQSKLVLAILGNVGGNSDNQSLFIRARSHNSVTEMSLAELADVE